jgi:hypothetical protein
VDLQLSKIPTKKPWVEDNAKPGSFREQENSRSGLPSPPVSSAHPLGKNPDNLMG